MQRTKWSQSVDCAKMMSAVYHHMGEFDRFEKAMNCFENSYPDTINPNYLICLEQRSEAAMLQGRPALSAEYLRRAYTIRDSLDRRNQRDQLNELATVYHLQEEQLARQQAEADARFFRWITAAIVIALIIALAFAVYFFYKRRETLRKNRALYELIVGLPMPTSSSSCAMPSSATVSTSTRNSTVRPSSTVSDCRRSASAMPSPRVVPTSRSATSSTTADCPTPPN